MKTALITLGLIAGILLSGVNANAQSKIIVYKKGCIYGAFAHYKVVLDGKKVANLHHNSIRAFSVTPGEHMVAPRQPRRGVKVNVRSGENEVVVYRTRFTIFGGRAHLRVMSEAKAKSRYKYFRKHADMMMK